MHLQNYFNLHKNLKKCIVQSKGLTACFTGFLITFYPDKLYPPKDTNGSTP